MFQKGQKALNNGQIDEADRDFCQVLAINPREGGTYANLGVVYMRCVGMVQSADELAAGSELLLHVAGIRLNIGLSYFRKNEFFKAIPLGHKQEGANELKMAVRLDNERRAQREKQVETGTVLPPSFC